MNKLIISFASGVLFAVGLAISGMTHPAKVIGFLDIFGDWDISLMFVMGGAVGTKMLLKPLRRNLNRPLFEEKFCLPTRRDIDARLLIGATLFGAGWGLLGYCPGPAITSIATFDPQLMLFIVAMLAGMIAHNQWARARARNHRG